MNIFRRLVVHILPIYFSDKAEPEEGWGRYRKLWRKVAFLTAFVSLMPLIIMTFINYYQYKRVFEEEMIYPISRLTSNTAQSLSSFIDERRSVLDMIIRDKDYDDLKNQEKLTLLFRNLKESFGGFIDMGVIDADGNQQSYVGPYELRGKNYKEQGWFTDVRLRGIYVSEVFMGYRKFPHFVIALMHEIDKGGFYVLRATLDMETVSRNILSSSQRPSSDAFLINLNGVLQTDSRFYGKTFDTINIPIPPMSDRTEVVKRVDNSGQLYILGYAYINQSPFILMEVTKPKEQMKNWFSLRNDLLWFLGLSIFLIILVVLWGANYLVRQILEADQRHAQALHNIEYTSKMASIGRLAAGVAHEINNPLSIINENAGLLRDIINATQDFPRPEKFLKHIDAVTKSVERCSTITHRLLGFAKRIDTQIETIDLKHLIQEVIGFLDKEAKHRNISIDYFIDDYIPTIDSDRGQLQQVFLNIINNSFDALGDGGRLDITINPVDLDKVAVTIKDNGHGISEHDLQHIFEPFFTSKKEHGTGLGLSITYGIIQKLGGDISVKSTVGVGTSFTVVLPIKHK
jgi:two-component system, NtrC family, sensor kinase